MLYVTWQGCCLSWVPLYPLDSFLLSPTIPVGQADASALQLNTADPSIAPSGIHHHAQVEFPTKRHLYHEIQEKAFGSTFSLLVLKGQDYRSVSWSPMSNWDFSTKFHSIIYIPTIKIIILTWSKGRQRTSSKTQIQAVNLAELRICSSFQELWLYHWVSLSCQALCLPLLQGEFSPGNITCRHTQRLPGDHSLLFARLTQVFLNYKICCSLGPSWITPFIMAVLYSVMSVVHQARILEWLAMSFSRGSSSPRDWTPTSPALEGCSLPQANSLPLVPPGKPHFYYILNINRIIPIKSKMSVETDTQRLLPVK